MALATAKTQELVSKFGSDGKDTGASAVQVAIFTERINEISAHLKEHKHDFHSTRGLLKLVGKRRRLLRYIQKHDVEAYRALIQELGIRK